MGLPPDSIVSLTLSRMQKNLEQRVCAGDVSQERSGLLLSEMCMMLFRVACFLITGSLRSIKPRGL
jgi:hypothetical protein